MTSPKEIGDVRLTYLKGWSGRQYSDGKTEDDLLEIYKLNNPQKAIQDSLSTRDWAMIYHLSPKRGNLLKWYDFKPGSRVIEVGAGCGAITEGLVRNNIKLTSLELSPKRALINAYRNKTRDNLEIVVGNLDDYSTSKPFDYTICIGVLEYAGGFIKSKEPYLDFLKKMRSLTKKNGVLLLAIENRLGLKYFAGAKEDHADNSYFDGINSYPRQSWVQTFGKAELAGLLNKSGFENNYFYYPFPDYKMPEAIFSEDYLPGVECDFPLDILPSPALDRPRKHLFSEQSAMLNIQANNLVDEFSNSFLVRAS